MNALARRPVDVRRIGDELASLWEQIEQSEDAPLCRVLTANVIVVAPAREEGELHEALGRVLLRHPCRAFLVLLQDGDDEVRVEVGVEVRQESSTRQAWLEEIVLRTPQRMFARIPGLLRPLLVGDLPTHLFWAAPLPEPMWSLATTARLADQTVVDSCRFAAPGRDLEALARSGIPVTDLAFFRVRPWRRAVAEAFETFVWDAQEPTRVTITRGSGCGAEAATRVLARWLQQRLGATVETEGGEGEGWPALEPARLELWHRDLHVLVQHRLDEARLRIVVTLGDHCLLPWETSASRGVVGDLLAAAIDAI